MRSALRITALILVLLVMLVPLAAQASEPCPDDPELSKDCNTEAPPFYVVINRSFDDWDRPGTGCQPIILGYSDFKRCCINGKPDPDTWTAPQMDIQRSICPELAKEVEWTQVGQTEIVYAMCCDCSDDPAGTWKYRIFLLQEDGSCPIDEENPDCYTGLPPGTGIDLPAPIIIGGLAVIGVALLAAGVLTSRRRPSIA